MFIPCRKKEIDQILMTLIAKGQTAETSGATSSASATAATTSTVAATKEEEEDTKYPAEASGVASEKGDNHRSDSSSDEAS